MELYEDTFDELDDDEISGWEEGFMRGYDEPLDNEIEEE